MISVKGLEKHFGKLQVLRGVDQEITAGEKLVVIGPSGSGKTTFLRCLNLLEEPTAGHIYFKGEDILDPKCNINKIRERMCMVFQQFNLFPHLSIMDNITLAPTKLKLQNKEEAEANAIRLLKGKAVVASCFAHSIHRCALAVSNLLHVFDSAFVDEESHSLLRLVSDDFLSRESLVANRQLVHVYESAALLYKLRKTVDVSC